MTQITKHDALLAIDSAMAALASARVMVEAIGDDPAVRTPDNSTCRHIRTTATFTGTICRDCGEMLTADMTPGEPDSAPAEPVSTLRDDEEAKSR